MGYDVMAAWGSHDFDFTSTIHRQQSFSGTRSCPHPFCDLSEESEVQPQKTARLSARIILSNKCEPSPPSTPAGIPPFKGAKSRWSPPNSPTTRSRANSALQSPPLSPLVDSAKAVDSPRSFSFNAKQQRQLAETLHAEIRAGELGRITELLEEGALVNTSIPVPELYDGFIRPKAGVLSPLAAAAHYGQLEVAELLIAKGASINPDSRQSCSSPLHQACKANDLEITNLLLELGADVNALNFFNITPLMYALKFSSPELVSSVLQRKPSLSVVDFIGTPPIHWALWPGRERNAQLLLHAGADPNQKMGDGGTALHHAAFKGLTETVVYLLESGASPIIRNDEWRLASHLAEEKGHVELRELLSAAEIKARAG